MTEDIKPATETTPEPVLAKTSFLGQSLPYAVVVAAIIGIVYKGLNPLDILKVAVGLGLVIFIHELGHFLAAKLCGVRVETFSIGFGEPIPGCRFTYGETGYKIGWIPLGGYVKMLGEGENVDTEEAEEDPRSFKNKPVGQRMIIISSGVVMNLMLAVICFLVAYMHGVPEQAPMIGSVESGSPAWRIDIHSNMRVLQIGNLKSPMFEDIRPIIMSTHKGEIVSLLLENPDGEKIEKNLEPVLNSEELFPVIGIAPSLNLKLSRAIRPTDKPYKEGSAAASAQPPLQSSDVVESVQSSDGKWIDLVATPEEKLDFRNRYPLFYRELYSQRARDLKIRVARTEGETKQSVEIVVPPQFNRSLGMRMQMGRITGIRANSSALEAKPLQANNTEVGLKEATAAIADSGDKIIEVRLPEADGTFLVLSNSRDVQVKGKVKPLDPARLPEDLADWADRNPAAKTLQMTVLRTVEHNFIPLQYELNWDRKAIDRQELTLSTRSPLSIPALGLCYKIDTIVDAVEPGSPADKAGIKEGDIVKEIRNKTKDAQGQLKDGKWNKVGANEWAFFFTLIQTLEVPQFDLKLQRGTGDPIVATIEPVVDRTWPRTERGFFFDVETVINKADDLGDAVRKGGNRTLRMIRVIYQSLYAMVFGRISYMTISGPLNIASFSYNIAEQSIWQFILLIGLINVNLAVVNFLPIPVLDGGHMAFLIYEKIRGKPANEKFTEIMIYIGLGLILLLMAFAVGLDIWRLFF